MYSFFTIIVLVAVCSVQGTVKVTVFYESLCPGSQEFINEQLYPTYEKLGEDGLTVELFPVSNVKKINNSSLDITCQHGVDECFANKAQVCAMSLSGTQDESVNFVGCVMSTDNPEKKRIIRKCARKNKLSWTDIKHCLNSDEGDKHVIEVYNKATNLKPKLRYFPHILFDDSFNRTLEESAREDLLETVCQMFVMKKPVGCPTEANSTETESMENF